MPKVLIIDDEEAVRGYLSNLITRFGYETETAATCAEGIEKMKNAGVEMIISDMFLPDSPPQTEWIAQLKEYAAGRPLVIISGYPSEELAAAGDSEGVMAFLTKPFELAFIKSMLSNAFPS